MGTGEIIGLIVQSGMWAAMIATLIVYGLQLKSMKKSSEMGSAMRLFEYLQDQEVRDARRHVILSLKDKDPTKWTDVDERAASRTCSTYDIAGVIIRSNTVPKDVFLDGYGASVIKCHDILASYIKQMQKINEPMEYWKSFDWLYDRVQIRHVVFTKQ